MDTSQRRAVPAGEDDGPPVEASGGFWRVRSLAAARQVLRARESTTQAGFSAEAIPRGRLKHYPILISDGPLHDRQRSSIQTYAPHTWSLPSRTPSGVNGAWVQGRP